MSGSTSTRGGFAITLSAVDNASKTIDQVNKRILAMRAPVDRVQRSLTRFADVTGIATLSRGMEKIAYSSLQAFENIGRIVAPLGAITSAASLAGITSMVTAFGGIGTQMATTARAIGISVPQLQLFENAARLAGASTGSMTTALENLKNNITDAAGGRAPDFANMVAQLGISLKDAAGNALPLNQILPQIANKIAEQTDPTLKLRIATVLLGGAGKDLLPAFRDGAAGLQAFMAEAPKYGIITQKQADLAIELQHRQVALTESVEGLRNSIAAGLAPVLAPLLQQMADWIANNREWIATNLTQEVQELGTYLRAIDWAAVAKGIGNFASEANSVAQAIGGWKPVLEGVFALMTARFAITMIMPFVTLLGTVGRVAVAMKGIASIAGPTWLGPLMIALKAYQDFQNPPVTDSTQWGPGSPFWQGAPGQAMWGNQNSPLYAAPSLLQQGLNTGHDYLAGGPPRGIRNNNPGNLEYRPGQGAIGSDGRFGIYKTMQEGLVAQGRQLQVYQDRDHLQTLAQIVAKWAPPGENDTAGYIQDMAKKMGVSPDAPLNLHDTATLMAFMEAQDQHETGRTIAYADVRGAAEQLNGPLKETQQADLKKPMFHPPTPAEQPAVDNAQKVARGWMNDNILSPAKEFASSLADSLGPPSTGVQGGSGTAITPTTAPEQTLRGSANINLRLEGFPQNTRATSTVDGNMFGGPPKIERAMVGAGP